ncbi:MAG: hypothetical protein KGR26_07040 [Cyanobacteria bacterium REEB65]|nr:hypothetical protein [Cyanobacteria bacterium REEB65]
MRRFADRPWRRLPTELALAGVLAACGMFGYAKALSRAAPAPPPRAIEEKLVVLPTPPAPPKPKSRPKPKALVRKPLPRAVKPMRRRPVKVAATVATADKIVPIPPPEEIAAQTPPPSAPLGDRDVLQGNVMGAKAIYQPLPQIPDDLRHDALDVVAVARFHVAADGSATVELQSATGNPELNALLLQALNAWRFFPALLDGKPIASTLDIRIPVEVR